jgi:aryl-alcohol dehydrogenase-like predicted oxidoreductase
MVAFTATCWGKLLNPKKMPPGEKPLTSAQCYRFALSNPFVDLTLCGPKNMEQMRQGLDALKAGPLEQDEMERVRIIGNFVKR